MTSGGWVDKLDGQANTRVSRNKNAKFVSLSEGNLRAVLSQPIVNRFGSVLNISGHVHPISTYYTPNHITTQQLPNINRVSSTDYVSRVAPDTGRYWYETRSNIPDLQKTINTWSNGTPVTGFLNRVQTERRSRPVLPATSPIPAITHRRGLPAVPTMQIVNFATSCKNLSNMTPKAAGKPSILNL